jgi:hypothetical protein
MEQIGPRRTDLIKLNTSVFLKKSVEKIQVLLKSDKDNGYFT